MNCLIESVLHFERCHFWAINAFTGSMLFIFTCLTVVCKYHFSQRKHLLLRTSVVYFLLKQNSEGENEKIPWNLHRGHRVEHAAKGGIIFNRNVEKANAWKGTEVQCLWLQPLFGTAPSHQDTARCNAWRLGCLATFKYN